MKPTASATNALQGPEHIMTSFLGNTEIDLATIDIELYGPLLGQEEISTVLSHLPIFE